MLQRTSEPNVQSQAEVEGYYEENLGQLTLNGGRSFQVCRGPPCLYFSDTYGVVQLEDDVETLRSSPCKVVQISDSLNLALMG